MLIFREQQLPQIFGQLNANVSSLLLSQIKTQIMNQYYKYLIHVYFLKKLVTPEIFQLFFFSTPKQNPAENSTRLRYIFNSKQLRPTCSVRSRVNTDYQFYFQKIQKTVLILYFVILYDSS